MEKIVKDGTNDEGPCYVCINSSIALRAKPSPAGTFPDGYPIWEFESKPAGSTVNNPETGETASIPPDVPGIYVIKAKCGTNNNKKFTIIAVTVNLDIPSIPEEDKMSGGLVVRNASGNNAQRVAIVLSAEASTGNVILTRSSTKVKIFTAETGGTEITFDGTDNKFSVATLPVTLYVEGAEGSDEMRDVLLTLAFENSECLHIVPFTVLWIEVSARHEGALSDDNRAVEVFPDFTIPPGKNLGQLLTLNLGGAFICRGSEFIGEVQPRDFQWPGSANGDLHLIRAITGGKMYIDNTEVDEPSASDTSLKVYRDDNPHSNGSMGIIYDIDAPGVAAFPPSDNAVLQPGAIRRFRMNFRYGAVYKGKRCSEIKEWYTRQSYQLSADFDSGTATGGGEKTLTDTAKSWATDAWVPGVVYIPEADGSIQMLSVTANTETTITCDQKWDIPPNSTSNYIIINTSSWKALNDVPGDNKNDDGTTSTTWDLR